MMRESEQAPRLSRVRALWEGWKRVAKRIGDVQARILLTIFYFLFLAPFALVVRWRMDPLAIKTDMGWRSKEGSSGTPMERASRQF
jgi:lipopolysaccharide/colanic/teichoic acid biosynthesis glycosyltransferase